MRRFATVLLLLTLLVAAGCGGGGKKNPKMTKAQFIGALNALCQSANNQVSALKLTTAMATWKQNGQKAARIARQTVNGFKSLNPPDELKKQAQVYLRATAGTLAAVQGAADAAQAGDRKKFDRAITNQQRFIQQSNVAATGIGATSCA